jgi:hypothetical protein
VRTLHNQPDSGSDPRGRPSVFIYSETAAITSYPDDSIVPLDNKGKPWKDITEAAGVGLPKTTHFKPPGRQTVNSRTVHVGSHVNSPFGTSAHNLLYPFATPSFLAS